MEERTKNGRKEGKTERGRKEGRNRFYFLPSGGGGGGGGGAGKDGDFKSGVATKSRLCLRRGGAAAEGHFVRSELRPGPAGGSKRLSMRDGDPA